MEQPDPGAAVHHPLVPKVNRERPPPGRSGPRAEPGAERPLKLSTFPARRYCAREKWPSSKKGERHRPGPWSHAGFWRPGRSQPPLEGGARELRPSSVRKARGSPAPARDANVESRAAGARSAPRPGALADAHFHQTPNKPRPRRQRMRGVTRDGTYDLRTDGAPLLPSVRDPTRTDAEESENNILYSPNGQAQPCRRPRPRTTKGQEHPMRRSCPLS